MGRGGLGTTELGDWTPALALPGCVTVGWLLHLSEPQAVKASADAPPTHFQLRF